MEALGGVLIVPALFVGVLFLYSGISKLSSLADFIQSLLLIPFLPHQLSRMIGVWIPLTEVLVGACLLWNVGWAKVAAIVLLTVFSIIALLAISRNQRVPCNCFGTDTSEFLSKGTVIRNSALVLAVAINFNAPSGPPALISMIYALIAFLALLNSIKAKKLSDMSHEIRRGSVP